MKTNITINGKEVEIELTAEQVAKIQGKGKGYPENDTRYWFVDDYGTAIASTWVNDQFDLHRLHTKNFYLTREEAKQAEAKQEALARVNKYIWENDLESICDWGDESQHKYYIHYNHDRAKLDWVFGIGSQYELTIPYLKSGEACEQVIKNCEADLLLIHNVK